MMNIYNFLLALYNKNLRYLVVYHLRQNVLNNAFSHGITVFRTMSLN